MQQILTYTFLVLYTVTILSIVLVIITDNRNPLKTLPWIIVLVFAPVVGLLFYFFFGQNLSKRRIISRRTRKRITMQLEEALDDGRPAIPDEHLPLARLLAATIHSVPLYGSRITPYTDGKSKMEALLAEIADSAWRTGDPGIIFLDAINRGNTTPNLGELTSTNPCGESPLYPNEACNLGSINIAKMVK